MKRGLALLFIIFLLVFCLFSISHDEHNAGVAEVKVPNSPVKRIILITLDTVRSEHFGFNGYFRQTTPFLDRIAAESIVFPKTICSMSHTLPAHLSLLTSLYPIQHGTMMNTSPVNQEIFDMAQLMKEHHFETAAFLSVRFLVKMAQHFDFTNIPEDEDRVLFRGERRYRNAENTLKRASEWLSEKNEGENFFVWLHLFDTHEPYFEHRKIREELVAADPDTPENVIENIRSSHGITHPNFEDPRVLYAFYNRYDTELRYMDKSLSDFYEFMEQSGLNKNSLWIITADHGQGLGSHGYLGHSKYIYNEQIIVPQIFHWPGETITPQRLTTITEHVDLLPTLLELMSLPRPPAMLHWAGQSLLPLMFGRKNDDTKTVGFSQRKPRDHHQKDWSDETLFSLQDENFKFIHHPDGNDELFDLRLDPLEQKDLFTNPDYQAHRNNFREILKEYRAKYQTLKSPAGLSGNESTADSDLLQELQALGYLQASE